VTEGKIQKISFGIWRLVERPLLETSRVWACNVCGSKVFHCRSVTEPYYQCLCGGREWNPVNITAPALFWSKNYFH